MTSLTFGLLSKVTGPHPMPATSKPNMRSIATMQYWTTRSQENESMVGVKSSLHGPRNRTKSDSASSASWVKMICGSQNMCLDMMANRHVVSVMEFRDERVAHETQYFGDAFEPAPTRAQWVEPMR